MYKDELELVNYMFKAWEECSEALIRIDPKLAKRVTIVLKPLDDDGFPWGELTTNDLGTPYLEELERDF